MEIRWAQFPRLKDGRRSIIESRLRRLAEGHHDLIDVHIVAQPVEHDPQRYHVKLHCVVRGHPIVVAQEHEDLGRALDEVLDDFERQVHSLRDRRRFLRRHPRAETSEPTDALGPSRNLTTGGGL